MSMALNTARDVALENKCGEDRVRLSIFAIIAVLAVPVVGQASELPNAQGIYVERCAVCHDNPNERIPSRETLGTRSADDVMRAFAPYGVMQPHGVGLIPSDIVDLAVFLTGERPQGVKGPDPSANMCTGSVAALAPDGKAWNGWGRDSSNARFHPEPGLSVEDVPRLKVKWTFAYPTDQVTGVPTVVGGRVFVGTFAGLVFALDAETGCTHWSFDAGSPVKGATIVGPNARAASGYALYISDEKAYVYALDAMSGEEVWRTQVESHDVARITGSPTLAGGRLFVPVSSLEELAAMNEKYECCTFRGSVVALDAATGEQIWKSYTVEDTPAPRGLNSKGVQTYGPAGGAIWSAPSVDMRKRRVFVGVGNSYTDVPTASTDAVIAFDFETGARLWTYQAQANDNWIAGCQPGMIDCPTPMGPDMDFGTPPILRTLPDGRSVIISAQKSGVLHALDPDTGNLLWQNQVEVGKAGTEGRILYAVGADTSRIYAPASGSAGYEPDEGSNGGLTAVDFSTGETMWYVPAVSPVCSWGEANCSGSQTAPPLIIPGVVFSGSADGHMRAYSTDDGSVIWEFDTGATFPAVNTEESIGGTILAGQSVSGGMLFVNSGRGFTGQPGNALMAFSVDGK